MGQYYSIYLKSLHKEQVLRIEPVNGLKLLEFSFDGSDEVKTISKIISEEPYRIFVIGDYAELKDHKNIDYPMPYTVMHDILSSNEEVKISDDENFDTKGLYFINLVKLEYVKLANSGKLFVPFILASLGNGKGGGDYLGINEELAGTWCGDLFTVKTEEEFKEWNMKGLKECEVILDDF